jgi:hypothetical protein
MFISIYFFHFINKTFTFIVSLYKELSMENDLSCITLKEGTLIQAR